MILTNARCIFADGIRDRIDVLVREGKIAEITEKSKVVDEKIIDLDGNYLSAGFIDLHIHGAVGCDTMEASPESFRAICDFHASGGTTSLLLTTVTSPIPKIVDVLKAARRYQESIAQLAGVHIEGPFISPEKPGAQARPFIQAPTAESIGKLLEFADVIKRITLAPEVPGALEAIDEFAQKGISVSGGHSDAWEEEARAGFEHGMHSVTHTFNCMSTMRRRGIYRVGGLLEFALGEPEINCELIADGHHVSPTLMRMLCHAKQTGGISLVTDATAGAGLENGTRFGLFGNECVIENGVCLLADGSALAGSASRMIDLVRTMVRDVDVPLHEAVLMATETPARAIGLANKGRLEVGADADLVVLSPELEVLTTFVRGEQVYPM